MNKLFNRNYELVIGQRNSQGILITGLRISFAIEKSLEKNPNVAKIDIYNLSSETRALVEQEKNLALLKVGYEKNLKSIFIGDIAAVTHKRSGADIITTLECGDGEKAFNNSKLDISFAPGTSMRQVLNSVKSAFGLGEGEVKGVNENDRFLNGLSLSGMAKDHMDTITKRQGLQWSIQDGQLQILTATTASDAEVFVLNPSSGLIGFPYRRKIINKDILQVKDGENSDSGIQCVSLLDADIKPGRRIKLESEFIMGVFRVESAKYYGDNRDNPWYVEIEAKEIQS